MAQYTTSQLFADCAKRNKRLGGSSPTTEESYGDVWEAILRWIESQLEVKKGASLSGFATFAWRKEEGALRTVLSPAFVMNEGFARSNSLVYRRSTPTVKELVSCEEMNCAKIAISFSHPGGGMVKDKVFTCWRQLLTQIQEVVADGRDVRLDFGVGLLTARERRVDFRFKGKYNVKNSNNNASLGGTAKKVPQADSLHPTRESTRESTRPSSYNHKVNFKSESDFGSRGTSKPPTAASGMGGGGLAIIGAGIAGEGASTSGREEEEEEEFVNQNKKFTARSLALEDAELRLKIEEARQRRRDERTECEMRLRLAEKNAAAEGIHYETVKKEKDLGTFLKKQIAENNLKKEKALKEKRDNKLECDEVTCLPSENIDTQKEAQKLASTRAQYAADLTSQILSKKMAMIETYEQDQDAHRAALEKTTTELENTLSKRFVDRKVKQQQLSAAWDKQVGEKKERKKQ